MEGSTLAVDGVASNPSAAILTAPVSDASAWRAADFIADRSWIVALTEAAIGEVDAALRHAQRQGKTAQTITRERAVGEVAPADGCQLKVMSAIERCRTAALGGHVERCEACAHLRISYSSCRNRHCPKCQAVAAKQWLADRQAELLPVPYFHVVFTLPGPIAEIAYQNQAVVYDLWLKVAAESLITIAADPKH